MFVTLEGPEGAGKSTQREKMAEWFRSQGFKVVLTREPGGTPLAECIRELMLTPSDEEMCVTTELLLAFAARAQHVELVIKPALAEGNIVLCDRFIDSTYAYQGGGRQISYRRIEELEHFTLNGFKPDKTFLFDVDVIVGLQRASARGRLDRMEQNGLEFFSRVQLAFLERMEKDPHRFVLIDGALPIDEVTASIIPHLEKIVERIKFKDKGTPAFDQMCETDKQKLKVMLTVGTPEQQREALWIMTGE